MKSPKKINTTITIQAKTTVQDVIDLSIDKIGAEKVVGVIRNICIQDALEKSCFPSSLLATKDDEEKANVGCALYYLKENFKECADKGAKMLTAKIEEAVANYRKREEGTFLLPLLFFFEYIHS